MGKLRHNHGVLSLVSKTNGKEETLKVSANDKQWPLFKNLVSKSVCVRMSDNQSDGAGVIIGSNGLILTAWHVLKRHGKPYVHCLRLNKKKGELTIIKTGRRADLIYRDVKADIAVIKVREPLKSMRPAQIGDCQIWTGAPLYRVGVDNANPLASGYLIGWDRCNGLKELEIAMPAGAGCSGGGVFDIEGQLVGIALRAIYDDIDPPCCYAIPLDVVQKRIFRRRCVKQYLPAESLG